MPPDAVTLVRELFELERAGRFDDMAARYRDNAVIHPAWDSARTLRGGEELARYLGEAHARGLEINTHFLTFWQDHDTVMVTGRIVIRLADAQGLSDSPASWRFELDDTGLVTRVDGIEATTQPAGDIGRPSCA